MSDTFYSRLRNPTTVQTGTSCTVSAGQYCKIDSTAGAYTATLVAAPADATAADVKLVASAATVNAVTVTCGGTDKFNLPGGSTTLTLRLLNQGVQLQYNAAAGVWDVHGDDLPLGQLDARYANVFSPLAYGAKGDGTTDDTAAMQACAAASAAAKGIMDLGSLTFKTSAAIPVAGNFHLRGNGSGGGTISNSASDLFTMTGTVAQVTIENCTLNALGSGTAGGHVFNASAAPSMSFWKILGVTAQQNSTSHAIWYQVGGGWIDCLVDEQCFLICSASATVSPWSVLAAPGTWNSVKFSRSRFLANGATVPFFNVDPGFGARTDTSVGMTASSTTVTDASAVAFDATPGFAVHSANFPGGLSLITAATPGVGYTVATAATATLSGQTCIIGASGWDEDIVFDHITWEVCTGGAIWMTGTVDVLISMCAHWDTLATSDIYHFATAATGYPCRNIIIRGGRGGATTGGARNFFADSGCTNILLDSFGQGWSTPPVISSPASQTTIINSTVAGTAAVPTTLPGVLSTGTVLSVGGNTGATAASRYAGATASGHPTTGTYAVGDFVIDQTGSVWICTTAGTPGTWSQVGSGAGFASADDPLAIGFCANYSVSDTTLAVTAVANAGDYQRFRAAGHPISNVGFVVAGSPTGTISLAVYTGAGSGRTATPTGGQAATTGSIACPAAGDATVALGSTVTPHIADWIAISSSAANQFEMILDGMTGGYLCGGLSYQQTSAHPLPSTPSSLTAFAGRYTALMGY